MGNKIIEEPQSKQKTSKTSEGKRTNCQIFKRKGKTASKEDVEPWTSEV